MENEMNSTTWTTTDGTYWAPSTVGAQQIAIDKAQYDWMMKQLQQTPYAAQQPPKEPIERFSDVDLTMELIGRGYAVWKPPVGE
jgi:hypothetical protein